MTDRATRLPEEQLNLILAELSLCQAHIDNSSQRVWQSGAIILAGALATLGLMLQVNVSELGDAVITTAFALGAITIVYSWQQLVNRERRLQKISIQLTSELEERIGFDRERRIRQADDRFRTDPVLGASTTDRLVRIGHFMQFGWLVVAAWRWLIYAGVLD